MIQGGDGEHGKKASLNARRVGTGGPGYKFADEPVTGDYARGTLAMANSGPNTNGSQFFICTPTYGSCPKNYTIFGQVTKGMDVVDAIASAPRNSARPARRSRSRYGHHGPRGLIRRPERIRGPLCARNER